MSNSVDPDETAPYEPSHLNLHCFHKYWFWSAGLKGLVEIVGWMMTSLYQPDLAYGGRNAET